MIVRHDVLAELELLMVPSLRARPPRDLYVPAEAGRSRTRRRHFWCPLKEQDVEVEFETQSRLGFPRAVGVKRCSAFDDPAEVACGRHCVDSSFRSRWPFALPVRGGRPTLEG